MKITDATLNPVDLPSDKAQEIKLFEMLVAIESSRRQKEMKTHATLEEVEKNYVGPEVGAFRRAFNADVYSRIMKGKSLLDFGCGGAWWKDGYWPKFETVYATEINLDALKDVGAVYPESVLIHTKNGLIDIQALPQKEFDVVFSSSVVGYILPIQTEDHLKCSFDLLRPGGQLVLTRVRAFSYRDFKAGSRLELVGPLLFSYAYRKNELFDLLEKYGFEKIEYHPQGAYLPVNDKINEVLYRYFPRFMTRWLPRIFPFFKIYHTLIAYKPNPTI